MNKVRANVFETNSSSSHSLVVGDGTSLMDSPFRKAIVDRGFINVAPGEYGWEQDSYGDPMSKLSYLYTDAAQYEDKEFDPNSDENDKLDMIRKAVKRHTGLNVVFEKDDGWYPFGYIDHQSVGLCDDVWNEGVEGVIKFVFDPNSYFETDNDNH